MSKNEIDWERMLDYAKRIAMSKYKRKYKWLTDSDIDDMVQTAMVKLIRYLPKFDKKKSSLFTYAYTIINSVYMNFIRDNSKRYQKIKPFAVVFDNDKEV